MNEILCPVCPGCQQPPRVALAGGTQWFCGNDNCHVFMWNPTKTLAENSANADFIELPDFLRP